MRWVIALFVGVVGCTPTSPDMPDAASNGSVLRIEWTGKPAALPAPAGGNVTLASAAFSVVNLRVIGDAGPGDPRTLVDRVALAWASEQVPMAIAFPTAPLGKYSRVAFVLAGQDDVDHLVATASFELTGTAQVQNTPTPFRITDDNELAIAFDVDVELSARADAIVGVGVDLAKIVSAVDFAVLPEVDGVRVLASDDAQAPAVRAKVVDAFAKH